MRMILVTLAALIVAGGAGFYVVQGLRSPAPAAQAVVAEAPALAAVYRPMRTLAAGAILTPDALGRMELPLDAVSDEMVVADKAGEKFLVGSVARQTLPKGVPIARSATVQPGDRGFLAAVLPKGKRAITIPVSETAGLNGLAIPGDWVDLILTYTVVGEDDDGGDSTGSKPRDIHASETVARNIRLLALDNRVNAQHQDDKGKLIPAPAPTSATLQVTPRQAEQIALATTLGSLSLTLNSVRDGGEKVDEMSADGMRPSPVEPVGLTKPALSRTAAAQGLDMTLDSDVTSLLRLEVQKAVPEQVSRIQVVRGRGNALAETRPLKSGADALAGAPEPADPEGE
jgi:pilus assembly protein CpaB